VLGGYCVAAFIAFEMAQQLRLDGETVEQLLLVHPQLPAYPLALLRFVQVTGALRRKSLDEQLVTFGRGYNRLKRFHELSRSSLHERICFLRRKVEKLCGWSETVSVAGPSTSSRNGHASHHREPTTAYPWAAAAYRPKRYSDRAVLFCSDNALATAVKTVREWRRIIPGATVHVLPGHHVDLVTSNAEMLAGSLRAALEGTPAEDEKWESTEAIKRDAAVIADCLEN